ncbi:MAG: hypothetical protein WCQ95_06185 [Bacteroidota bacterium]
MNRIVLPDNLNPKDFVPIFYYTSQKQIRPDIYYAKAATGKIRSVAVGDMVFMMKQDADQIPIKRWPKRR